MSLLWTSCAVATSRSSLTEIVSSTKQAAAGRRFGPGSVKLADVISEQLLMPSRGFTMASGLGGGSGSVATRPERRPRDQDRAKGGRKPPRIPPSGLVPKRVNHCYSFFLRPLANAANRKLHFTLNHYITLPVGLSRRDSHERKNHRCYLCGSNNFTFPRQGAPRFLSQDIGSQRTRAVFPVPGIECRECGLVRQDVVSFVDPRRSRTRSFERIALVLSRSIMISDVARRLNVR